MAAATVAPLRKRRAESPPQDEEPPRKRPACIDKYDFVEVVQHLREIRTNGYPELMAHVELTHDCWTALRLSMRKQTSWASSQELTGVCTLFYTGDGNVEEEDGRLPVGRQTVSTLDTDLGLVVASWLEPRSADWKRPAVCGARVVAGNVFEFEGWEYRLLQVWQGRDQEAALAAKAADPPRWEFCIVNNNPVYFQDHTAKHASHSLFLKLKEGRACMVSSSEE